MSKTAQDTTKTTPPAKTKSPPAAALALCRPGRPRRQKTARQLLSRLLAEPLPPHTAKLGCLAGWAESGAASGPDSGTPPADLPGPLRMYEGMLLAQVARALEGDLRALQFIREAMGERAEEKAAPEGITAGDRALLRKLAARLGLEGETP